ncbi:MAG: endonuclease domain-containing protein [Actinomycetota bacterium]|nr:endonuclease domain-containing protein [Actinomycetota bacterium]
MTAPVRTIFDLASSLDARTLSQVVNEAQVQRDLTLGALERRLAQEGGKRGVNAVREIVAAQRQPSVTRSTAEDLFRTLVDRSGLPRPRTDFRIGRYRADFAWPELKLVAELDSIQFHSTQPKFVADRRRWAELDAMGWRVFRFTWWDVTDQPEALLVRLTRSLMRDASPG